MASARKEAVLLEAGLVEIRKKAEERWVVELVEKQKKEILEKNWGLKNVRSRLVRENWWKKAEEIRNRIIEDGVKSMKIEKGVEPWSTGKKNREKG